MIIKRNSRKTGHQGGHYEKKMDYDPVFINSDTDGLRLRHTVQGRKKIGEG
jgi:hypothetical protein